VQPFADPQAFLTYAQSQHPRLVGLDISMPLMHGREVQKRLRDVSPKTHVIVMTGKDDRTIRSNALSAGAAGFLIKPIMDEELLSGVEAVLGQ
jgi:FixJ family two-component response regulator